MQLPEAVEPAELADMRARICIGMKRYFYSKNVGGLLSNSVSTGFRSIGIEHFCTTHLSFCRRCPVLKLTLEV